MTPIQTAIHLLGASGLAKAIGVKPQFVAALSRGQRPVPSSRCLSIEIATNGAVTRYDLRPDVFGPAPKSKAA